MSILQPQYVWFWVFDGFSIFKISAGIAILAVIFAGLKKKVDFSVYNNGIVWGLLGLLVLYYISDMVSPFQSFSSSVSSDLVIGIYLTIVIMFFVVLGLINNKRAAMGLAWSIIAITIYYAYWANDKYFSYNWAYFENGRLLGPFNSPYADGNALSIIFVIGLPFILFGIFAVKKVWLKALLILSLPFIWHGIILCASRGALLSAGVASLATAFMVRSKVFNIFIGIGVCLFIIDQGAQLTARTSNTIAVAQTESEEPINPRLISWKAGFDLSLKHPILGVGPERFQQAVRFYFPGRTPHVAHSTLINFLANLGYIAAFIYLYFFYKSWRLYKENNEILKQKFDESYEFLNKATFVSLIGFFVGAMFLDLIIFEPFYFLLILMVSVNYLLKKVHLTSEVENEKPVPNSPMNRRIRQTGAVQN
ncbi:O-antigen ligase family protein [Glaciecola sp. 1036]|uniref:O-antigen ligase family protein n=1 Tax=Alteromonadaceae TaxID=72275 RepID=UPI003D063E6C